MRSPRLPYTARVAALEGAHSKTGCYNTQGELQKTLGGEATAHNTREGLRHTRGGLTAHTGLAHMGGYTTSGGFAVHRVGVFFSEQVEHRKEGHRHVWGAAIHEGEVTAHHEEATAHHKVQRNLEPE